MKNHLTSLLLTAVLICAIGSGAFAAGGGGIVAADPSTHFDAKGKTPSTYTLELQKELRTTLPFEDTRDFEEARQGFIAAPPYKQIMAEDGHVVWDMGSYGGYSRAGTSTPSTRHCSGRPSSTWPMGFMK